MHRTSDGAAWMQVLTALLLFMLPGPRLVLREGVHNCFGERPAWASDIGAAGMLCSGAVQLKGYLHHDDVPDLVDHLMGSPSSPCSPVYSLASPRMTTC